MVTTSSERPSMDEVERSPIHMYNDSPLRDINHAENSSPQMHVNNSIAEQIGRLTVENQVLREGLNARHRDIADLKRRVLIAEQFALQMAEKHGRPILL